MKNEQYQSHDRYYIYHHNVVGVKAANPDAKIEDMTIKYRKSNGEWTTKFEDAMLWNDYDFAVTKAETLKREMMRFSETWNGYNVCVGKVVIQVDPYFMPFVIK